MSGAGLVFCDRIDEKKVDQIGKQQSPGAEAQTRQLGCERACGETPEGRVSKLCQVIIGMSLHPDASLQEQRNQAQTGRRCLQHR